MDTPASRARREVDDDVLVEISLAWERSGEVQLVGNRLAFPQGLVAGPAQYRFRFIGRPGPWVSIGET